MRLLQNTDFHLLVGEQPEINILTEDVYYWWGHTLGSRFELAVLWLAVLGTHTVSSKEIIFILMSSASVITMM